MKNVDDTVKYEWNTYNMRRHEKVIDGMASNLEIIENNATEGVIPAKCAYDLERAVTHLENVREVIWAEIHKREAKN